MKTTPFLEFPDFANMTDRQLALLTLYEIAELKAELRAATSLLLQVHDKKPEKFNPIVDRCQQDVINAMVEHARPLMKPPPIPPLN